MKSKIISFFGCIAFFIRICFFVFLLYLDDSSICKEKKLLFAILSIILFSYKLARSFLWTSLMNTAIWAIFLSLIPKVKIWYDIFFTSLLLAIIINIWFYFGDISKHIFIKAWLSKSNISLFICLDSILSYIFHDKLKFMIEWNSSSLLIYLYKK